MGGSHLAAGVQPSTPSIDEALTREENPGGEGAGDERDRSEGLRPQRAMGPAREGNSNKGRVVMLWGGPYGALSVRQRLTHGGGHGFVLTCHSFSNHSKPGPFLLEDFGAGHFCVGGPTPHSPAEGGGGLRNPKYVNDSREKTPISPPRGVGSGKLSIPI